MSHAAKVVVPACVDIPKREESHKSHALAFWIEADHPWLIEVEVRDEDERPVFRADLDLDALDDLVTLARQMASRAERSA